MWSAVERACQRAKVTGALKQIQTKPKYVKVPGYEGTTFVLRVAENLKHKPKGPTKHSNTKEEEGGEGKKTTWFDPFARENLDEDLFVSHLSETHSLILNKFNVVEPHLLLITSSFESQDNPVNARDFRHLFRVFASFPRDVTPLAFYNCGPKSGMSQPHKHVQIVPMPLAPCASTSCAAAGDDELRFPLDLLVQKALQNQEQEEGKQQQQQLFRQVEGLPYVAYLAPLSGDEMTQTSGGDQRNDDDDDDMNMNMKNDFLQALEDQVGVIKVKTIEERSIREEDWSYNLLLTPRWCMLVPRRSPGFGPIGINAMGFAGTFLLRSTQELDFLLKNSAMDILTHAGYPSSE